VALSGRFPLLAGVDLEVAIGETVLIEGPNGAGKTSLLRLCAGLVAPASGRVAVLGLDPIRNRMVLRRRVGFLAHASHLYDDLTVRENVRFAVRAAGGSTDRIPAACERLGLVGRLLRTSASKLSAGQRRRVALAVLVARSPDLWLLDEPHAGLDASARTLLGQLITEASAGGATVVVASHEANLVEPLADRAVTITGGRVTGERIIRAVGEPAIKPLSEPLSQPLSEPLSQPVSEPLSDLVADPNPTPDKDSVIHVA
jgi:heme ABC exporter ATP-binding subunit CcmA